jgi:hypothetical protein
MTMNSDAAPPARAHEVASVWSASMTVDRPIAAASADTIAIAR